MANMRQNAAIRINVSNIADVVGMETYFMGGRLVLLAINSESDLRIENIDWLKIEDDQTRQNVYLILYKVKNVILDR